MKRVRKLSFQFESLKKRPVIADAPRRVEQVTISPPRPTRPEVDADLYDLLALQPVPVLKHSHSATSTTGKLIKKNTKKGLKNTLPTKSSRSLDCPWMDPSLREDPFQCPRPSMAESETSTYVDTDVELGIAKSKHKKLSAREWKMKPLPKLPFSMLADDGSTYESNENKDPFYDSVSRGATSPCKSSTRQLVIRKAATTSSLTDVACSAPPKEDWDPISVPHHIPRRRRYRMGGLTSKSNHLPNNTTN